jgi:hypothetical protein
MAYPEGIRVFVEREGYRRRIAAEKAAFEAFEDGPDEGSDLVL